MPFTAQNSITESIPAGSDAVTATVDVVAVAHLPYLALSQISDGFVVIALTLGLGLGFGLEVGPLVALVVAAGAADVEPAVGTVAGGDDGPPATGTT